MKKTDSMRKGNFLFSYGNKPLSSGFPLPLLLLLVMGFLLWQTIFPAEASNQNSRKQVYASATARAEADIKKEAQNNRWQDYTVKMNVFIPNEVSNYPPCKTPLQVALPQGHRLDLARLRYDIICQDPKGWSINVTIKPDIYLPVLVTQKTIERGEVLKANDIQLKRHNISKLRGSFLIDPDDVVGLTAKRRIRPLQPLNTSQLDMPVLVTRGQKVIMIASVDGIEARVIGEAMKNGRKGDLIKVRNLNSNQLVSAVVDDIGVVRIPTAMK